MLGRILSIYETNKEIFNSQTREKQRKELSTKCAHLTKWMIFGTNTDDTVQKKTNILMKKN